MTREHRKARDLPLLDEVDTFSRDIFDGHVWRITREGRDPVSGSASQSRWCNGQFDVLYTSLEENGAMAEIDALLSLQPVFPSKMQWHCYKLKVKSYKTLNLADFATLKRLGVGTATYKQRRYDRTQEIADAAYFLGFDGLLAPSARWPCQNLVLFTERLMPEAIQQTALAGKPIDWEEWRKVNASQLKRIVPNVTDEGLE